MESTYPERFKNNLSEIRTYYLSLREQYLKKIQIIDSHLYHLDSLISSPFLEDDPLTINTNLYIENSEKRNYINPNGNGNNNGNLKELDAFTKQLELHFSKSSHPTVIKEDIKEEPNDSEKLIEATLISPYEGLSQMDAIKMLLKNTQGTISHVDFVVASLYGLNPGTDTFKVIKSRVSSALVQGKKMGLWYKIQDCPGCYTYKLDLINKTPSTNSKSNSKTTLIPKTKRANMKSEYAKANTLDSITYFLKLNAGKIFTITEIVLALYGNLEEFLFRQTRDYITKELSRGQLEGAFFRVPGEQGKYTWDIKLLQL